MENRRKLYRTSTDKWLGGVLGGIAAYLDWDPALLRIGYFVDLHASRRRNRQLGKDERTKHVIF